MNWLAHLHLATLVNADAAASILPDVINPHTFIQATPKQKQAMTLHQAVDYFTDQHQCVLQAKIYCSPSYKRFSGILVDLFFDYCLCQTWQVYSQMPLDAFIAQQHQQIQHELSNLPVRAQDFFRHLMQANWLSSYQTLEGMQQTLQRLTQRLKNRVDLAPALQILIQHEMQFLALFHDFYPDLQAFVRSSVNY